jgi:hypothetical protein
MNVVGDLSKWATQTRGFYDLGKQKVDFYSKLLYNTHINAKTLCYLLLFLTRTK